MTKTSVWLIFSLLVGMLFLPTPSQAAPNPLNAVCDLTSGSGTELDPWVVSTSDQLGEIYDCSSSNPDGHYQLQNDLSLTGIPGYDGSSADAWETFSGHFDGGNHSIDFSLSNNKTGWGALFSTIGKVGHSSSVTNLTLSGSVSLAGGTGYTTGALAATLGDTSVSFSNVTFNNFGLRVSSSITGGTGLLFGKAANSGVDKYIDVSDILASSVSIEVPTSGPSENCAFLGGYVGQNRPIRISESSVSDGKLVGWCDKVGGFVGQAFGSDVNIQNSHVSSMSLPVYAVTNQGYGGGFVGYLQNSPAGLSSISAVSVSLQNTRNESFFGAGGLVGYAYASTNQFEGLTISSAVVSELTLTAGQGWGGGLVGRVQSYKSIIENSTVSNVSILAESGTNGASGGILGSVNLAGDATTRISQATVERSALAATKYSGGLVGSGGYGSLMVSDSYVFDVSLTGLTSAGGLIGRAYKRTHVVDSIVQSVSATVSGSLVGGVLASTATITNGERFTISGVVIDGFHGSARDIVGGVMGKWAGSNTTDTLTLSNLKILSSSLTAEHSIGGVVGEAVNSGNGGLLNISTTSISNLSVTSTGTTSPATSALGGSIGGLIGFLNSFAARISNASVSSLDVQGSRTLSKGVGGLVGFAKGSLANLAIEESLVATSSLIGAQSVGGVIGYSEMPVALNMAQVLDSHVESDGGQAGGFVGNLTSTAVLGVTRSGVVDVEISGSDSLGGFVGNTAAAMTFSETVFAGTISASAGAAVGGYVGSFSANVGYSATSSYYLALAALSDFGASAFALSQGEPLSLEEAVTASSYALWDFSQDWVIGSPGCYPVLAALTASLNTNCVPQTVNLVAPAPTPIVPETPAVYRGPVITNSIILANPGQRFKLEGLRLETISEVFVDGILIQLESIQREELGLLLPENMREGIFDLVIFSSYGRLTVMNGISITKAPKPESYGNLLGYAWVKKFTGNSRALNVEQKRGVDQSIAGYAAATTIVCWGYTTSENPNDWAIAHATARAKAVCDRLAASGSSARLLVRVRYGMPKFAAMRATMQFWELKSGQ